MVACSEIRMSHTFHFVHLRGFPHELSDLLAKVDKKSDHHWPRTKPDRVLNRKCIIPE